MLAPGFSLPEFFARERTQRPWCVGLSMSRRAGRGRRLTDTDAFALVEPRFEGLTSYCGRRLLLRDYRR